MIEIQCPRCKQYWYSDVDEGRVRLCDRCADDLRRKRGPRPEVDVPFLIGVVGFVAFDLLLVALAALSPAVFGKVLVGFAVVMLLAGWVTFRLLQWEGGLEGWLFPFAGNIDWRVGRWALLSLLSGLACLLAFGSILGFRR
jgi:hypothetical protein